MTRRILETLLLCIVCILSGLLFARVHSAYSQTGERINNFAVTIRMMPDSAIEVEERIEYDFGDNPRHGIFRDIPVRYRTKWGSYRITLSVLAVHDENGASYPYRVRSEGDAMRVQIGDPDITVSGPHAYVIRYHVRGAINFLENHDELYWNVTGNGWNVPIDAASARVVFPESLDPALLQVQCYQGVEGSIQPCSFSQAASTEQSTEGWYVFHAGLAPREGITIVAGLPKGILREPSAWERFAYYVKDNWIIVTPVLVLGLLFYLWYTRGRDPAGRGVVIAQFDPPNGLRPIEIGALLDERVQNKDISSEIIDLAVRGYIRITRIEKKRLLRKRIDYELEKTARTSEFATRPFDYKLMDMLFSSGKTIRTLSELKKDKKASEHITAIKKAVYKSLVTQGYFPANPSTVRWIYAIIGIVILGGAFFFGGADTAAAIAIGVSGACILAASPFMPARTKKGVLAKEHVQGLKLYLEVAEKDRLAFHHAPEKNPKLFETLLPYAMALGVEHAWAAQFKDIYKGAPEWYHDAAAGRFTAVALADSLSDFRTASTSAVTAAMTHAAGGGSGFGGGGAGGGFGGGGGGSW